MCTILFQLHIHMYITYHFYNKLCNDNIITTYLLTFIHQNYMLNPIVRTRTLRDKGIIHFLLIYKNMRQSDVTIEFLTAR